MSDCALYLISPPRIGADFFTSAEHAFEAGKVKAFQLRLKDANDEQILEAAGKILPLCRKHDIAFILNDRADLAKQCGADGIHLGQEDMSIADARAILGPHGIIGMSCHASRDMGIEAAEMGADYVAFGAFYPTTSKPREKVEKWGIPTPDIIQWWAECMTLPCVAIGGMTPHNCAPLVTAGTDFIAAITYIWDHPKGAGAAVHEFAAAIAAASPQKQSA